MYENPEVLIALYPVKKGSFIGETETKMGKEERKWGNWKNRGCVGFYFSSHRCSLRHLFPLYQVLLAYPSSHSPLPPPKKKVPMLWLLYPPPLNFMIIDMFFQKIFIFPPWKFFVLVWIPHPSGNSSFTSYSPLKNLALKTPFPFRISSNLAWGKLAISWNHRFYLQTRVEEFLQISHIFQYWWTFQYSHTFP